MDPQKIGRAPNFTTACIVMFGVNLGWILLFLFAVYGLVVAVFVGLVVNRAITWLEYRRKQTDRPPTARD